MEIKSRFSNEVIFKSEKETLKASVENAVSSRANLYGADLSRANLSGANLSRANLYGADLYGADLSRADLYGADLSRADLSRADLSRADLSRANLFGANLSRADLYGADLSRANLFGANLSRADLYRANLSRANLSGAKLRDGIEILKEGRFIFFISPIGSRNSTLTAYNTTSGIMISTGCFFGSVEDFIMAVGTRHAGTVHFKDYTSAIEMIQRYFSVEVKP